MLYFHSLSDGELEFEGVWACTVIGMVKLAEAITAAAGGSGSELAWFGRRCACDWDLICSGGPMRKKWS
jgi:hypothetical protein